MSENKFNIFNHLQKTKGNSIPNRIKELRLLVKELNKENNELVEKIWDINLKLDEFRNEEETRELLNKKSNLEQQLDNEDYASRIAELTKTIHDLEIQEYGSSDYGSRSVFKL